MDTPLNASATPAGALMSNSEFEIPPYQREYSWQEDEVADFWNDLRRAVSVKPYFLGLIILTAEQKRKQVVDGQQRLITLTLLAAALYHAAVKHDRKALAERIQSDFLSSIDYATDETFPRVKLTDPDDDRALQSILESGNIGPATKGKNGSDSLSERMRSAFAYLEKELSSDLANDPFKRLGAWTEFLTNQVYFAVFTHPDAADAYRVFEVINTRGRELTTADLLKNYILSQTPPQERDDRYKQWQSVAKQFSASGSNSFVQYIRHVTTLYGGYVLPRDLFDFIAHRQSFGGRSAPSPTHLIELLEENLPIYLQMIDPTVSGPADQETLQVFEALNQLGVMSVRPMLLAIAKSNQPLSGIYAVLTLVVRRIVVGNLGTGNVERRLSEAAHDIFITSDWSRPLKQLENLNPTASDFTEQLRKRSLNKSVLSFLRRSALANCKTPEPNGTLHLIRPREAEEWYGFSEEDASYWVNTIGNTMLAQIARRPKEANSWEGFKDTLLPYASDIEKQTYLNSLTSWTAINVQELGEEIAKKATDVWF